MAQRRRVSNTPYIYDNTARDLQIRRQMEEPRRQMSHETRKNREKARHMSIGYVTFLMGALIACAFCLVNYIQMQSELTTKITEVSRMESELNSLKLSNDEEYSRITSNINLEEVINLHLLFFPGFHLMPVSSSCTHTGEENHSCRRHHNNS